MVKYHNFTVWHCYSKIFDFTKRIGNSAVDLVFCDNLVDKDGFFCACHCNPILIVVAVNTGTDEVEHKLCRILTGVALCIIARIALKLR